MQSDVSPVVHRGGKVTTGHKLWHAGQYRETYLAVRGLISMYKTVCQELDCSRCSFTCKSHTAGFTQSVCDKQKGRNSQDHVCGVFADTTQVFYMINPPTLFGMTVWHNLISSCADSTFTERAEKNKTATLFTEMHFHSKALGGGSLSFRVTPRMAVTLCETWPATRLQPCSMLFPTRHKQ